MPPENNLPPLPESAPGKNEYRYRSQHGVILVCPDEKAQALLFEALSALRSCKIKVVVT